MAEDADRAERALARALREHADDHDFRPLDADALVAQALGARSRSPRRARRAWPALVAAAVVLVLAVPLAALLLGRPGTFATRSGAPAQAPAEAPAPAAGPGREAAQGGAGPGGAGDAAGAPGVEAPPPGQRWESMLDVAVLVPDSWGYGFAPGPDWCAADGYRPPAKPFVDRNPLSRATLAILCTQPMPDALRQTHLTWRYAEPADADGVLAAGSWAQVNRRVGAAFLTVEVPADQIEVGRQVLATAQVVAVDPRGCPLRGGDASPTDGGLAGFGGISAGAVCQYVVDPARPGPNLAGSYALDAAAATSLAETIVAAPRATLPADEPTTCARGEVLLVRFTGHTDDVRSVRLVTGAGCGPFAWDDGAVPREPSRATCADLLTGPLWQAAFDQRTGAACAPR